MRVWVALFMLISLAFQPGVAWSVERNWCGVYGNSEVTIDPAKPLVKALAIFVAFQPYTNTPLPSWASDLDSDFAQYLTTMSGNVQDIDVTIAKRPGADSTLAWMAPHEASYYNSTTDFEHSTGKANYDVVAQVSAANPSYFLGVDVIFMLHFECTVGFRHCGTDSVETASPSLGFETGPYQGAMVQMESIPGKEVAEAGLMHEYLHKVGADHPPSAANYGRYDLMNGTEDGLSALPEGLVPVHPFELTRDVDWAPAPEPISSSTLDLEIPDFFGTSTQAMRKTYLISLVSPQETIQSIFLVNHQGATAFDSKYGGTGLLVWHFLEGDAPVARDLEVASGKFNPYPEGPADPASGKDALEASTPQNPYLGSASDFFDGVSETDFSYSTNPNTDLYGGSDYDDDPQNVPSGVAIENIRQEPNGRMQVDVYLTKAQLIESPNGGEEIERGSVVNVAWRVRSVVGYQDVDVAISDDGATYRTIDSGLPNTGAYSWHVLQKAGTYKLKLVSRDSLGNTWSDESDASFTITDSRVCAP